MVSNTYHKIKLHAKMLQEISVTKNLQGASNKVSIKDFNSDLLVTLIHGVLNFLGFGRSGSFA